MKSVESIPTKFHQNVNEDYKFIFIHVPKTGGVSVRRALFKKGIGPHTSALKQRSSMGKKYDKFSSIAFVRNPWDRLVSTFFYLKDGGMGNKTDKNLQEKYVKKHGDNFNSFVKNEHQNFEEILHTQSQHRWICDNDDHIIVDYLGRFETLRRDFDSICKDLDIPHVELPHSNKSNHGPYRGYYDRHSLEIVERVYRKDIKYFRYKF